MRVGFLGLGKMGKRMVWKLLEDRHDVYVWNRSATPIEELVEEYENISVAQRKKFGNLLVVADIADYRKLLRKTRVFWSMLPAGEPTESVMEKICDVAQENDVVIDGGNAYYKDTQRRYDKFKKIGVRFLGIGVSGGIHAAENGFPLMVGGDRSAYDYIRPILRTFARPHGGFEYFGTGGVGHFIKMVHNGIEYGMMQSLGEGFGILDKGPYTLELQKVASLWQKGTIVSSFLLDRAVDALEKDPKLEHIVGEIDATGEAEWTIQEAEKEKAPAQVIKESLQFRIDSKENKLISKTFAARLVAALRREFGGHKVKER